jgi:hypothetical protein
MFALFNSLTARHGDTVLEPSRIAPTGAQVRLINDPTYIRATRDYLHDFGQDVSGSSVLWLSQQPGYEFGRRNNGFGVQYWTP